MTEAPPESERLYPGAILGSTVHAIMNAQYPMLAHEQSWSDNTYSVQNSQGARGAVSFSDGHFVGVAFDSESSANPRRGSAPYDVGVFFRGMPATHRPIADQAMRFMIDDYRGRPTPLITAAFWDRQGRVDAAAPWIEVLRHGARLFRRQLMTPDEALLQWSEDYEMSSAQLKLARELFRRRIATPKGAVTISQSEWETILKEGDGSGEKASRESFAEIGFLVRDG